MKGGGWIYLTGEGCWTSGGGWKSKWLQWPEVYTVLIIFYFNNPAVHNLLRRLKITFSSLKWYWEDTKLYWWQPSCSQFVTKVKNCLFVKLRSRSSPGPFLVHSRSILSHSVLFQFKIRLSGQEADGIFTVSPPHIRLLIHSTNF